MSYHLLPDTCRLCGFEDRDVKRSLWFDPATKQYVVVPRCTDRLACARRVAQAVPETYLRPVPSQAWWSGLPCPSTRPTDRRDLAGFSPRVLTDVSVGRAASHAASAGAAVRPAVPFARVVGLLSSIAVGLGTAFRRRSLLQQDQRPRKQTYPGAIWCPGALASTTSTERNAP